MQKFKFFDIAANMCDDEFQGIYHDKKYHEPDVDDVIKRAQAAGVTHFLFAAGSIEDADISYDLSNKYDNSYITCGVHPCRASEELKNNNGDISNIFSKVEEQINKYKDKLVAIGECGLDYDRLHYSVKEDQLKIFPPHFALAQKYNLPMYLHCRNTGDDFYNTVKENRHKFQKGIAHSFTGTQHELEQILSLDLYIGLTGTSFKSKENLEVIKNIPLDKLCIETDAPYCEIKSTSAGFEFVKTKYKDRLKKEKMKKGFMCKDRNEPCAMIQVLEALSGVLNKDIKELSNICYENSMKLFNITN